MTAIIIVTALAAFTLGLFIGAIIAAGGRAEQDQTISQLRHHLQKIIKEAETSQIKKTTLQNARRTLTDEK